ncbi:MAG: peptidoglycan-binding protein, partial [Desulfobacteraceae bacterium]|nr:peptidoglycan-binding protein [Desulfobacteraceae bacterium]
FLVPSNAINLRTFKSISFEKAMQQTRSVAKRMDNFDIVMDLEPQQYTFVSFMMNQINKSGKIIPIISDFPYSDQGKKGQLIKTKDGWLVAYVQTKFAYNNFQPQYFNILWKTDNGLIPIASYSTHGLVKEMQIALTSRGYNVGNVDGRLNKETKSSIKQYIKTEKFHSDTKISTALLWFMQQTTDFDILKIVQAALLNRGEKIGTIDGKIGPKTIQAVKKYQKTLGAKPDGKITPNLVYLLLYGSNNIDTFRTISAVLEKPIFLKTFQEKKWPNQI